MTLPHFSRKTSPCQAAVFRLASYLMSEKILNMENEILREKMISSWKEQSEAARRLEERGLETLAAELDPEQRDKIFFRANGKLGCMDEGCIDCGFRMAGSGILIAPEDLPEFERRCAAMGVAEVTHHENCGAAGVYAKKTASAETPAALAEKFSASEAKDLGLPVGYIGAEEMARPAEFHATRFAYYDGTKKGLNLKAAAGALPNGFVLTRGLYPKAEYAVAEAQLAFDIASGHHGFGELITEDEPFAIIVVADSDDNALSFETLTAELAPLAQNPKIKIIGLALASASQQDRKAA
jgi:hypothetical protein